MCRGGATTLEALARGARGGKGKGSVSTEQTTTAADFADLAKKLDGARAWFMREQLRRQLEDLRVQIHRRGKPGERGMLRSCETMLRKLGADPKPLEGNEGKGCE